MKKLIMVALLVVIVAAPVFAQANPAQTVPFDHWAYDAVDQLVQKGIIIGYPDGTFKGDRAMTRYEFAMAISRLMDVIQTTQGLKGDRGDQGPAGPAGTVGVKGDKGDTGPVGPKGPDGVIDEAKIAALVNKLVDEFRAELKDLRGDLDALTDDVADLTDRVSAIEEELRRPKVFGWIDYRIGSVGSLNVNNDAFDNMTAMLGVQGRITDDLQGRIALKVRDSNAAFSGINPFVPAFPPYPFFTRVDSGLLPIPFLFTGWRPAEQIWLDEAMLVANSRFITPATWTFGRQFQSYGMGLLVNNERMSQQGVRVQLNDVMDTNINVDVFAGGVAAFLTSPFFPANNPYNFANEPFTGRSDWYISGRASYSRPSWTLGLNFLESGVREEQGWSADLAAQIWGRDVRVEYAQQLKSWLGTNIGANNDAWMASAELWRGRNWGLTGYYSRADGRYDIQYSALHPYFEATDPLEAFLPWVPWVPWEKMLRNPLVERGFQHVGGHLNFALGSFPITVMYLNRDLIGGPEAYDHLVSVGVSKQLADGITGNLTYGYQHATGLIPFIPDQQLLQGSVTVGF